MTAKSGDRANERTLLGLADDPRSQPSAADPGAATPPAAAARANDRTLLGVATPGAAVPRSATHVAALKPGAMVSDRYVLGDPIMEGGMATIWSATDRVTGRPVVVKSIHLRLSDNVEVIHRFQQEADIIAALRSPHIVELLDRGVLAGAPYLVLERLEGEDLELRLRSRRLTVAECVTLLDQVALALLPAHQGGVVHRDVKPANIFFARSGDGEVVKLLDFGIAKLREGSLHLTAAGQTVGSPDFMSPEQIQGRGDLDGRSDLFAMASVLYTCLTGKPPFAGPTIAHTFERTMAGDLVPPSWEAPEVPERIDAFFKRALAFDRDERYPDAATMAQAFRVFADDDTPDLEVAAERASAIAAELRGSEAPRETVTEPRRDTVADVPVPAVAREAEPPPKPRTSIPSRVPLVTPVAKAAAEPAPRSRWLVLGAIAVVLVAAGATALALTTDEPAPERGADRPSRSRASQVPAAQPLTTTPATSQPRRGGR